MSAAKKVRRAACELPERKVTWASYWPDPAALFWSAIRTEPTGTDTALRMLVGGSPEMMIGESCPAATVACSGVPATPLGALEVFTRWGDCVVTIPMVTKTTRMSTARPRTTIAGRMEIPPGRAGRWGHGEGALVDELGAGVVQRHAQASLRPRRPPEMVEGPVPRPQPPARAADQRPGHELLRLGEGVGHGHARAPGTPPWQRTASTPCRGRCP